MDAGTSSETKTGRERIIGEGNIFNARDVKARFRLGLVTGSKYAQTLPF